MGTKCLQVVSKSVSYWGKSEEVAALTFFFFFSRNCLSSGNELEGPIRRKQGSHNRCSMVHGKKLRTEGLKNCGNLWENHLC